MRSSGGGDGNGGLSHLYKGVWITGLEMDFILWVTGNSPRDVRGLCDQIELFVCFFIKDRIKPCKVKDA